MKNKLAIKVMALLLVAIIAMVQLNGNIVVDAKDMTVTTKISQAQAINIAKKELAKQEGNEKLNLYTMQACDLEPKIVNTNSYLWSVEFSFPSTRFSFDIGAEDGKIYGFFKAFYSADLELNPRKPAYTIEQAQHIAEALVKEYEPDALNHFKFIGNSDRGIEYGNCYFFRYLRQINGIYVLNETLDVAVDWNTGKVIKYRCIWNKHITYPEVGAVIGEAKAKELFKKSFSYDPFFSNHLGPGTTYRLLVRPYIKGFEAIDAISGKQEKVSSTPDNKTFDIASAEKKALLEKSRKTMKIVKIKDKASAKKLLEQTAKKMFGNATVIDKVEYENGELEYGGIPSWKGVLRKSASSKEKSELYLEAATGDVCSYQNDNANTLVPALANPKWPSEKAYKKAVYVIAEFCKTRVAQVDLKQNEYTYKVYIGNKAMEPRCHNFSFERAVNGVSCEFNDLYVSISKDTGEIMGITTRWDEKLKIDNNKKYATKDALEKQFFSEYKPVLCYMLVKQSTSDSQLVPKLMYLLKDEDILNDSLFGLMNGITAKFEE